MLKTRSIDEEIITGCLSKITEQLEGKKTLGKWAKPQMDDAR